MPNCDCATHWQQKLSKLTALDLQVLYTDLAESGLSPRSVHHVHRVLHGAFVQAVRWKLLPRNPCDGATAPKAPRAELNVWSAEEADTFQIATREQRLHALYVLALTTGMRQGELLGLKWADIDFTPEPWRSGGHCSGSEGSGSCSLNRRRRAPVARSICSERPRRPSCPQGPAGIRPPSRRLGMVRARSGVLRCRWRPTQSDK